MKKIADKNFNGYRELLQNITDIFAKGRHRAFVSVNSILVETYWRIGKEIVEFEQHGRQRADYGTELLNHIARDLNERHGKGFSRSNVYVMRQFYIKYPNPDSVWKIKLESFYGVVGCS